jgi:hypothetical protein
MWEWTEDVTRNLSRCTLRVVRNLMFVEVCVVVCVRTSGCVLDRLLGASRAL